MNKKLGENNLTLSSNDIKKVDVLQSRAAICAGSFFFERSQLIEKRFSFFLFFETHAHSGTIYEKAFKIW